MSFFQIRSKTQNNVINTVGVPTVETAVGTNITDTSFDGNGTVVNDNGFAISARGFVYSSSNSNPTLSDSVLPVAGTLGSLTGTIGSLSTGVLYYYRAYATNSIGTGYGAVFTVTTTGGVATVYAPTQMMMGMGF